MVITVSHFLCLYEIWMKRIKWNLDTINKELLGILEPKMSMMVVLKDLGSTNIFKAGFIEFIIHTWIMILAGGILTQSSHLLKIVEYSVMYFYKSKNIKTLMLKIL